MAIEFNCPHCGVHYKLDDKFAGKMGKCKNAKCQQQVLIPFASTNIATNTRAAVKPIDAELLAAAAFAEEQKAPPATEANTPVAKKIAVVCQFCDHKFEADGAMAGKNTLCPECGKIIRVPKPVEEKPADWRNAAAGKPSLAKNTEPAPAGVWDETRKGVTAESLRKAGALDVEDEEEPGERRIRRLKRAGLALAIIGVVFLGVRSLRRTIQEDKRDRLIDMAVKEIEEGTRKPEFRAAIHCYAGEYGIREANRPEELQAAVLSFNKSRDQLQSLPETNEDRNAMLAELGASLAICGGDKSEADANRRLPWKDVHPMIRKCLDKLPSGQAEARTRAFIQVTRKLAERDEGLLAMTIARNSTAEAEQPETIGRVGIELFLLNKKDQAEKSLAGLTTVTHPAATALWLALHADVDRPPSNLPHLDPPADGPKGVSREARIAYAEGRALQGRFADARTIAKMKGSSSDKIEAFTRIAAVANAVGKPDEAGQAVGEIASLIKSNKKGVPAKPWVLATAAEQAAAAKKDEAMQQLLDAINDDAIRTWARLGILRNRLAARPNEKADENWLETFPADKATVAQAMAQADVARHNARVGDSSYIRTVDILPKGIIRPFGYAGIALGTLDRKLSK